MTGSKRSPVGVGIIGLGTRGMDAIARNLAETYATNGFRIAAVCDRNPARSREASSTIVNQYRDAGVPVSAPKEYTDGSALVDDPDVELIMITSTTDTHREFAVPALARNKRVYCDKPLAQNAAEAIAIVEAETETQNPMIIGFTRRYERPWIKAHQLLEEGAIGRLVMLQVRDIIPYHRYLTGWWRRRAWSGGALNDKGSHIFDVFNWFADSRAKSISGLGARSSLESVSDPPVRCQECDWECPFRRRAYRTAEPVAADLMTHGQSWVDETEEKHMDDVCVYRPGADIYHSGNVQISYANGVAASYIYTLFGPPSEDEETLELVGTKGRMILTRGRGSIDLLTDHGRTHRQFDCRGPNFDDSHYGADKDLIAELRDFCDGIRPRVSANAGLQATRMVEASLRSMDEEGARIPMEEIPDASL